jgi:DNA/RNA-binding domain of Phe-tRNA-synthetase-like protein
MKTTEGFIVDPDIWARFPGMRLVGVAGEGLDNRTPRPAVTDHFENAQYSAFEMLRGVDPNSFLPFTTWRALQPGKEFPAAHENLGLRVRNGKRPRPINPLVDLYNGACIDLLSRDIAAPMGAWCATELPTLRLGVTRGGESFQELGKQDAVTVAPGEVAYLDGDRRRLVTRHFVWRQSILGAVSARTTDFIIVSELVPPYAHHAEMIRDELVTLCGKLLDVPCRATILEAAADASAWEVAA